MSVRVAINGSGRIGRTVFRAAREQGADIEWVAIKTDPAALPWGELGVDVVIESPGKFRDRAGAAKHLEAGARKVIISAPGKDPDVPMALIGGQGES